MGLASSDLLLVERSNTVYKETFGNRANIDATDLILVERSNTIYKCAWSDWDSGGGGGGGGGTHAWSAANTSKDIEVFYNTGSSDSTSVFRYFNESMAITGGDGTAAGNLYIGLRLAGSTAYYHDFCLSHVQVLNSAANAYRTDSTYTSGYDWNFHNTGNTNGYGAWRRATSISTFTTDPSTLAYTTISSASNGYWSRGTSTGSTYTGAADGTYGVSYMSGGGGSFITGTRSQTSNTYYLFTETSGSGYTIGTSTLWLKSPAMTLTNGDRLRMSYHAHGGTNSSNGLGVRGDSVLYFRFK